MMVTVTIKIGVRLEQVASPLSEHPSEGPSGYMADWRNLGFFRTTPLKRTA